MTTPAYRHLTPGMKRAKASALLLHAGDDPAHVPVALEVGLVWLTADGRYAHEAPEVAE